MKLGTAIATLGAAMLWQVLPTNAAAQPLSEVTGFGTNPGELRAFKHIPQGLPANSPLVVALHGCTQSASAYDEEPGWVKYADIGKFALLLPQQSSKATNACFTWFQSGDITRNQGEALSIKQMIDKVVSDHNIDPQRIYITGLSAGGAMTAVMLATYPEVFHGGAIIAGLPYRCATSQIEALTNCMTMGRDQSPAQWGNLVRAASPHGGPWPKVSIWQGTADPTVKPTNAKELIDQWTNVHGIDQTPDEEDMVDGKAHQVFKNGNGEVVVESYTIAGMKHATPINPGSGESECGTPAAYISDENICSSYYIAKSWGLLPTGTTSMSREQLLQRRDAIQKQIDQLTEELQKVREALEQSADSSRPNPPLSSSINTTPQMIP